MIKPIPQFEVWQSSRYLIFFESFEDDNSNKAVRDDVDRVFKPINNFFKLMQKIWK